MMVFNVSAAIAQSFSHERFPGLIAGSRPNPSTDAVFYTLRVKTRWKVRGFAVCPYAKVEKRRKAAGRTNRNFVEMQRNHRRLYRSKDSRWKCETLANGAYNTIPSNCPRTESPRSNREPGRFQEEYETLYWFRDKTTGCNYCTNSPSRVKVTTFVFFKRWLIACRAFKVFLMCPRSHIQPCFIQCRC